MTDTSVQKHKEDLNNAYNIPVGINVSIVKKEVIDPEVPNLGACDNLVLNSDCDSTNSGTADRPGENVGDPAEIQECLAMNQSLQRRFVEILHSIQNSLDRNIAKQAQIGDEVEESKPDKATKLTSRKSAKLFCLPYFRDVRGLVPPDNEDTKTKTRNRDITAYVQPPRPWSDEEKTRLLNGVLASALDFVLKKHKAKRDFLKSKLSSPELSDEEKKQVKRNIREIEKHIVEEHKRNPEDLLKEADGNIDWLKVSATDLEGGRSEHDCEIMWNNYLSIFVNKKPFTKAEDAKLYKLAKSHKQQNWDGVAQLLGTQRTAIQCIERYQTELNKDLLKSFWAPEEDEKLLEIIETVRVGNFIPWNQVLLYMEGRARHQIITRYERTLKGSLDKGPWSKYEDAMLTACVAKFGPRWARMHQFFPRRTPYHIRERFVNHLDPSLKIGSWTREEDVKMGESILKHGYRCLKCTGSQESSTQITACDRSIASIMCDEFREQTSDCALLMPKDEQPIFFDCAENLGISTFREWPEVLGDLCKTEDIAQSVSDLITCWDEKMNATVDEMEDDKVYPFEHFNCKEKLYKDAVRKTDCLCQLEKGMVCRMLEVPKPPTFG